MKNVIPPGKTIGFLGGGQLGRMSAQAAQDMGYRTHIYAPEADSPAFEVSTFHTLASYDNQDALLSFAKQVDIITCEFENVPATCLEFLNRHILVRPSPAIFSICQERLREKSFLHSIGVPVTPFKAIATKAELAEAMMEIGYPAILKAASFGYDGKGQAKLNRSGDLEEAWAKMGASKAILEAFVDFRREISVIVARNAGGGMALYEPAENQHRHHILDISFVPARISQNVLHKAEAIAKHIALEMKLEGLLAVEMFVTNNEDVLVNELAPRPHNSGHWSMDAAVTSQFEQFIRAICNLPLGSPERLCDAIMVNLLGKDIEDWQKYLNEPKTKLHLYGKLEARHGRKMGHITRLMPRN